MPQEMTATSWECKAYASSMIAGTGGEDLPLERAKQAGAQANQVAELWSGYDLCALDGSTVCGPGATGTDARLHANIRLSDLRVLEAQVTDPAVGETFKNFSFEPGQLVLADRGCSNAPGIAWVREHQADVLVRLNRGALPIFDPEDGQTIDVLAWVRSLPDDTAVERAVFIKDATAPRCQRIEGRLVATRLPPTQTQEARARVQREQGSDASSDTMEMAGYVVLFTTTPSSRLSAAREAGAEAGAEAEAEAGAAAEAEAGTQAEAETEMAAAAGTQAEAQAGTGTQAEAQAGAAAEMEAAAGAAAGAATGAKAAPAARGSVSGASSLAIAAARFACSSAIARSSSATTSSCSARALAAFSSASASARSSAIRSSAATTSARSASRCARADSTVSTPLSSSRSGRLWSRRKN